MLKPWLWLLFLALLAAGWGAWHWRHRRHQGSRQQIPEYERDTLLTAEEKTYHDVLTQAISGRSMVFAKVRLADLLAHPGTDSRYRTHWQRVQRRYVDFVVCDSNTFPVLAIKMERRSGRRDRNNDLLTETLRVAELPLLWVRPRAAYQTVEVAQEIQAVLKRENENQRAVRQDIERNRDESGLSELPRKIKRWTSDLWMSVRGA